MKHVATVSLLQEQLVAAMMHNKDVTPVTDPVLEYQRVAGTLREAFDWVGQRVNTLGTDLTTWSASAGEQLRAEITLWEKLLTLLTKALGDMARLGIEERHAKMESARGELIAIHMRWLVSQLAVQWGLSTGQTEQLRGLVVQLLTGLQDGTLPPPVQEPDFTAGRAVVRGELAGGRLPDQPEGRP